MNIENRIKRALGLVKITYIKKLELVKRKYYLFTMKY